MIEKEICNTGFISNPINCECECDKSWDVGEYLDYENSEYRKRLIDKLVEGCSENIDDKELQSIKMIYNSTVNSKWLRNNCTYYFFNDVINIKDFDSSLLKNIQKHLQKYWNLQHWIYYNNQWL